MPITPLIKGVHKYQIKMSMKLRVRVSFVVLARDVMLCRLLILVSKVLFNAIDRTKAVTQHLSIGGIILIKKHF